MANFPTHIAVGTITSGMLATLTLAADVVAPENLVAVTVAGVLGSVLPDIDLKDSRPSRALFSGLAAFFAFATLFMLAGKLSVAELWLAALAAFLGVRYVAHFIFHRMSYHRGIYHSLLAAVFFALLTAAIYSWMLGRHEGVAWLAAAFMFFGYMTHLILDEIYSVDVMDTRIKASFGTAVKPIDFNKPWHSVAMAVATVAVFMVTPPTKTFVDGVSSKALWAGLQQRLLPRDKWFGVVSPLQRRAETLRQADAQAEPVAAPATPAVVPEAVAPITVAPEKPASE
ncbi:MAG: metal-dependent hydrolase [Hyphomicrobiaceae bacterium]